MRSAVAGIPVRDLSRHRFRRRNGVPDDGAEQLLRHARLCFAPGLAIAVNTTLSAFAPKVAGRLFDQGVGYGVTFYFLAAWCFIGAVALIFMRNPGIAGLRAPVAAGGGVQR